MNYLGDTKDHLVVSGLEEDARRVLVRLRDRLMLGQQSYGYLEIERDPRDFLAELQAELLDAVHYLEIHLKREGKRGAATDTRDADRPTS
jgi:hypothetical protein